MVIGIDASRAFIDQATGTENYSKQLLLALLQLDRKNTYYIYVRPGFKRPDLQAQENVKIVKVNFSQLWTQAGLALRTFQDPLDVLFVPAHTLPLIHRPGLATVMTVHDLGAEYLPTMHQVKQQLYLKFITTYQLKMASHLIAVSEATKKDLIDKVNIPSKNISVIYEGIHKTEINEFKTGQTLRKFSLQKKAYFLFIGTIQPRKNLLSLIEAFGLFLIENKNAEVQPDLVIAGKLGWDYDKILALPKQLGIEKKVKFVGRIDDEEAAALYNEAIGLVYPSLFEGFGLPILEAYSQNCPVITSNTSSMPEIAGKGAILVDPYQTSAIMRAMQLLWTDKILRAKLVKEGKKQLTKFSWNETAKQTLSVLEKTAQEVKK